MDLKLSKSFFFRLSDRLNLLAGVILVFNFLNPQLASAEILAESRFSEPTFVADPGTRLVRPAAKPHIIKATLTAYNSTPDQTDGNPFVTASGSLVSEGTIAANGLPFGAVVKIPSLFGDQKFVVTDRMNARYGFGRMDVWLKGSRAEALRFGVKRVPVEIYYPEK